MTQNKPVTSLSIRNSTAEFLIFSQQGSWTKIQLLQNLQQLPLTAKIYQTDFYNLDAIISVGYRVNSLKATQFRQLGRQA